MKKFLSTFNQEELLRMTLFHIKHIDKASSYSVQLFNIQINKNGQLKDISIQIQAKYSTFLVKIKYETVLYPQNLYTSFCVNKLILIVNFIYANCCVTHINFEQPQNNLDVKRGTISL